DAQQLYRQLLGMIRKRFLGMDLPSPLHVSPAGAVATPTAGPHLRLTAPAPVSAERQQALQAEFADWAQSQLDAWKPPTEEENRAWEQSIGATLDAQEEIAPPTNPASDVAASGTQRGSVWDVVQPRALQIHDCY